MSKTGVPESKYEQFANPPLKAMFGQVRFPALLKLSDPSVLGGFQEAIAGAGYSEFEEEQQMSLTISPQGFSQSPAERTFRFSTEEPEWSVVLGPSSLTLEAHPTQYTNFKTFSGQFETLWNALTAIAPPTRVLRQGLRYIDHLEQQLLGPQWNSFINPQILGILGDEEVGPKIERSMSEYRFVTAEGTIVFKHGMAKAGPEDKPGYLLDFDYFDEQMDETADLVKILSRFETFHDELHDLFRYCVTEEALEEFRNAGN